MTRDEFMKGACISSTGHQDEDKDDAVQYYTDYFEEAGPDRGSRGHPELGSPERIAAIIRADIAGHLESGGELRRTGDIRMSGSVIPAMPWQSVWTCRKRRRAAARKRQPGTGL